MCKYLSGFARKYLKRRLRERLKGERVVLHAAAQFRVNSASQQRYYSLDGRKEAVFVNAKEKCGKRWIKIVKAKPFGFQSSNWVGSTHSKKRRGLRRQAEAMLRAAKQNRIYGYTPRVIVRFTRGVSRPVAEALREMGAAVEGETIEPPAPRAEREQK